MCGIAGDMTFYGCEKPVVDWSAISDSLKRRGPDDKGQYETQEITFVFRRLSIIDLSNKSRQPILDSSSQYALVFNGELYNFRELRAQLMALGHRFHSAGDSEVVLHALIEWGEAAIDKFNGMFGLAFFNNPQKKLTLARDHAGIKPLYYGIHKNGVAFGSQLNCIIKHPWFRNSAIDTTALSFYLHQGYIPAPLSIYKNTHMLEPGTWKTFDIRSNVKHHRYFRFTDNNKSDDQKDISPEQIDAIITSAVKRQVIADVPIGTFLSGGIDSPLISAIASEAHGHNLKALTVGFPGTPFNELPDAAKYAKLLDIQHISKTIPDQDVPSLCREVAESCQEPFADHSIFPTLLITRVAKEYATVMLSGDGGDELFWGYPERFGSVIAASQSFKTPRTIRYINWYIKKYLLKNDRQSYLRQPSIGNWYFEKHSIIPPSLLHQIFPDLQKGYDAFEFFHFNHWDPTKTAEWLRVNEFSYHLTRVLLKVDRASMYNSLEVRVPLLDREVVRLSQRLDWQSCLSLNPLTGKMPLRRLLEKKLPFQTKAKSGFESPMGQWLRGPLKTMLYEYVYQSNTFCGMPVNTKSLKYFYDLHMSNALDLSGPLWLLLSLKLWEENMDRCQTS